MGTHFEGRCHCGAVRFEVELLGGLETATRCNCSFCSMRGAVALTAEKSAMKVYKGFESLGVYSFGTHTAQHYFCGVCGIYTHHIRRSNPKHVGVNAACLEGLSPFDFEVVPVIDGQNHPRDISDGAVASLVGTLAFKPEFAERELPAALTESSDPMDPEPSST
ncbi:GFA family protein [Parvularcula sp. ZS-1/3]|uniref:GFA family protein n=1 Tax=Parvularcula mediterranea TaxID=2732508 RepID=A0A7Y3W561_9PROT|nr:GFA family protein [Parvularcula mediterranea]NNU16460.1 GFA family protein [Parvularcula mediterranea]